MLKFDGYTPPDKDLETKTGIKFTLEIPIDKGLRAALNITAISAGRANVKLKAAAENNAAVMAVVNSTDLDIDTENNESKDTVAMRSSIELLIDHVVIAWDTDLTVDGKAIESTRENFIEILMVEEWLHLFTQLTAKVTNISNFKIVAEETTTKK